MRSSGLQERLSKIQYCALMQRGVLKTTFRESEILTICLKSAVIEKFQQTILVSEETFSKSTAQKLEIWGKGCSQKSKQEVIFSKAQHCRSRNLSKLQQGILYCLHITGWFQNQSKRAIQNNSVPIELKSVKKEFQKGHSQQSSTKEILSVEFLRN